MTNMHFKQNTTEKLDYRVLVLHRNQSSSCKNTYGGMVQLFTQTQGGMILVVIREWFTLKCFVGDGVVRDKNMIAISASSA